MFADLSTFIDGFLYSESTTKLSKINNSLRYKTIHDPRQSDQNRLVSSQEKNTSPMREAGPLSRDSQHKRSLQFVNKKSPGFLQPLITGSGSVWLSISKFVSIRPCRAVALRRRVHSWLRFLNHVPYVERGRTISINLLYRAVFNRANFLRRLLRANITFSDVENHVLNKLERMSQH